jgi:uncharacterized membrane protein YgcG
MFRKLYDWVFGITPEELATAQRIKKDRERKETPEYVRSVRERHSKAIDEIFQTQRRNEMMENSFEGYSSSRSSSHSSSDSHDSSGSSSSGSDSGGGGGD